MSRDEIVESIKDQLFTSQKELTRLEAALEHVSKVPEAGEFVTSPSTRRGRGRPKGSKNRPKDVIAAEKSKPKTGRGRGRPKGSKNKPKLTLVVPSDTSTPSAEITTVSQPPETSLVADMPVIDITPLAMEPVVTEMPPESMEPVMEISVGGPLDDPQTVE